MKKIVVILALLMFTSSSMYADAASRGGTPYRNQIAIAINKYKAGNFIGCFQDMDAIATKDPSIDVAHYYLAISSVKIGNKDYAIKEYKKVIALNKNHILVTYAKQGLQTLTMTQDQLNAMKNVNTIKKTVNQIGGASSSATSGDVKNELDRQNLNRVKSLINSGNDVDNKEIKKFDDYTPGNKLNQNTESPSNEEIANAVKVLAKLGINPLSQYTASSGMTDPSMASMNMLMGNNSSGNNNMMNMLPLLMNGQNGSGANAEAMQSMIMNSMMQNSFNMNDNKN